MKDIYIKHTNFTRNRATVWRGTLEEMIKTFSYTLECGHSWNSSIPLRPKQARSLVSALNKSADECRRYNDYYEAITKEEYDNLDVKEDFAHSKTIYF